LTLPSAKAAGFSFLGDSPPVGGLTVSPRAFKVSVCPTATRLKKRFASLVFASRRVLGFRTRDTLSFGKCFTHRPTRWNRQHSVIKERCADSRRARYIIPDHERIAYGLSTLRPRFILSAKAGGFLAMSCKGIGRRRRADGKFASPKKRRRR